MKVYIFSINKIQCVNIETVSLTLMVLFHKPQFHPMLFRRKPYYSWVIKIDNCSSEHSMLNIHNLNCCTSHA